MKEFLGCAFYGVVAVAAWACFLITLGAILKLSWMLLTLTWG